MRMLARYERVWAVTLLSQLGWQYLRIDKLSSARNLRTFIPICLWILFPYLVISTQKFCLPLIVIDTSAQMKGTLSAIQDLQL